MTGRACTCDGTLRLISLFDGIAGFPLAFSRAGVPTIATVEIDKAAAGVAAAHFPDPHHYADVTEVTADELISLGLCPVHTVLSAGWPCTDLSLAGLRLGLGGTRSGLVGEVFRLLLGLQPGWFVLENVPGLLSSVCPCPGGGICSAAGCDAGPHTVRGGSCGRGSRAGRHHGPGRCMALHGGGMGTVLRRLGECGYGLAYRVLDAQNFGVPQRRRRVVIVGHLGDAAGPAQVLLEPESRGRHPRPGGPSIQSAARGADLGAASAGGPVRALAPTLAGGGKRGYRVDAETAAGGGLVTTSLTTSSVTGTDDSSAQGGHLIATTLTAREGKGPDSDVTTTLIVGEPEVWQQQGSKLQPMGTLRRGNGNVTGGVPFLTHALTAEGADASEDGTGRGTPLVPVDLAQVTSGENRSNPQPGDPAATLPPTSRPAVAFGHTNGIDVQASESVTPTLRAGRTSAAGQAAMTAAAVRRLTPVECERLQGYPDGWTEKAVRLERDGNRWRPVGETVQADAPRYRELGNSIAVPVFVWVARRLVAVDAGEEL